MSTFFNFRSAPKFKGFIKMTLKKLVYFRPLVLLNVRLRLFILQRAYQKLGKYATILEGGVHPKHRLLNYHKFFIENVNPEDAVLDLGCGNSLVALDVANKARDVLGVDLSERNIRIARENLDKRGSKNEIFKVGDATKEELARRFDKVILSNVLEYIDDRIEFLRRIRKLSPVILLRVPMLNRDWQTVY